MHPTSPPQVYRIRAVAAAATAASTMMTISSAPYSSHVAVRTLEVLRMHRLLLLSTALLLLLLLLELLRRRLLLLEVEVVSFLLIGWKPPNCIARLLLNHSQLRSDQG